MKQNTFTIITGASMGIGKAFAFECAEKGRNLLLVALPDSKLEQVQRELESSFSVTVLIFPVDLTAIGSVKSLFQFCLDKKLSVQMLINNAGMGVGGRFENIALEKYLQIMDLNNKAMVLMCHYFLPLLQKESQAYILNMSSMEATLPLPYKAVYTGSKNFVYAFSLALREEQKNGPVSVTVVCPGPVSTNPDSLMRANAHGNRAKWVMASPEKVAKSGLEGLLKGKAVIVPGRVNQVLVRMMKLVPTSLKMNLLERLFRVYSTH
ncbi:SDR family NAD(P)-dependent oxidoreductase [Cyclobacterium jeungdonense]|uniref:SDR family NAD(P)-dependent oxidoreductase n=1 Tax=Cyclobacterium jeungdonense TaxID=708087 RepID=A0ABT8CE66_9BACT|nr:SDR family NAD(P)-dependent oxidoreductase [Cyclobacterium jeungdonense]MDN3690078.1 SDR family NAD(P)-dependent oxidoreductase [Cyclobacterium jeungdonense]